MLMHKKKLWLEQVVMEDKELNKEEVLDLKRKRNSDLVWLNDTWIYKELHPYVHEANRNAGWNFDWERSESLVNLQNIN